MTSVSNFQIEEKRVFLFSSLLSPQTNQRQNSEISFLLYNNSSLFYSIIDQLYHIIDKSYGKKGV
jgi:hypothetical protein